MHAWFPGKLTEVVGSPISPGIVTGLELQTDVGCHVGFGT